jgi:aspartyl-tRNA(Asn)/glutamyl-tRNA(Gln) amidotransferase subunit A
VCRVQHHTQWLVTMEVRQRHLKVFVAQIAIQSRFRKLDMARSARPWIDSHRLYEPRIGQEQRRHQRIGHGRKAAGAILIAKTNPPEFSYSIETDNFLTGQTNNPWNLDYSPGGSSGGESAAIAAGMSPLGVGSDLSISLRGPAAHTGIVGFKATHGRLPMTGHWPRVPRRVWHIGPMARSVRDVALAYSLMAGPDGADGFSISPPDLDTGVGVGSNRPLRVGWLASPGFFGPTDPEVVATVKAAADALRNAGHYVEQVRLPVLEQTDASAVLWQLQQMESRPEFEKVTAGRPVESAFGVESVGRLIRFHRKWSQFID